MACLRKLIELDVKNQLASPKRLDVTPHDTDHVSHEDCKH